MVFGPCTVLPCHIQALLLAFLSQVAIFSLLLFLGDVCDTDNNLSLSLPPTVAYIAAQSPPIGDQWLAAAAAAAAAI